MISVISFAIIGVFILFCLRMNYLHGQEIDRITAMLNELARETKSEIRVVPVRQVVKAQKKAHSYIPSKDIDLKMRGDSVELFD